MDLILCGKYLSLTDIQKIFEQLTDEPEPFLRTVLFEKLRKIGLDMAEPSRIMLRDKFARNRIIALQYLYDKQAGKFIIFA